VLFRSGVVLAMLVFTRLRKIDFLRLGDLLVCAVPIGLFLGRLANFVNGELYGRVTDVRWAMQFPTELLNPDNRLLASEAMQRVTKVVPGLNTVEAIVAAYRTDPRVRNVLVEILTPRHPSQLYEATLEGFALFVVLFVLQRFTAARQHGGFLSGVFLTGYAIARMFSEYFREPDQQLGYLLGGPVVGLTMGQLLSVPVLVAGIWLIRRSRRETPPPAA